MHRYGGEEISRYDEISEDDKFDFDERIRPLDAQHKAYNQYAINHELGSNSPSILEAISLADALLRTSNLVGIVLGSTVPTEQ